MSRLAYASHMRLPRPDDAPIHSATTAPISDNGATTFNAAKRNGRADGHRAWRKYCPGGASTDRNQSAMAGSTERNPSRELISTGKNVRRAVTTTFGAGPKPNHTVRIGAMAMIGVDLMSRASDITPCSSCCQNVIAAAIERPSAPPRTSPPSAWRRVVPAAVRRSATSSANTAAMSVGAGTTYTGVPVRRTAASQKARKPAIIPVATIQLRFMPRPDPGVRREGFAVPASPAPGTGPRWGHGAGRDLHRSHRRLDLVRA